MAGQENLQIVREIFAAWNAHDIEAFVKRLDQKATWESDAFPAPFSGHEGGRQFFRLYIGAFPDLHLDIEQILAIDPYVIVRWRSTGTHLGKLGDIQPTARKVAARRACNGQACAAVLAETQVVAVLRVTPRALHVGSPSEPSWSRSKGAAKVALGGRLVKDGPLRVGRPSSDRSREQLIGPL